MINIEARPVSREIYRTFLGEVPHIIFQRLDWLEVMESACPIKVITLGYFNREKLIAVTPLLCRRLGPLELYGAPLRKCPVPAATRFCAPLEMADLVLPALKAWACTYGIGFIQVTLPSAKLNVRINGGQIENLVNLELNIKSPIEVSWKLLPKAQRYCVRKAIRSKVRLHWGQSSGFLDIYKGLLETTYGRQGTGVRPNHSLDVYRAFFADRTAAGLRILCASIQGRIIAATWVFVDSRKCYYWDAAANDEGRSLYANHMLVWCLIRWAHQQNIETLDFVGGGQGRAGTRPGIGQFKRSMGAEPIEYHIVYWYSSIYRWLLAFYRLWSRLEICLRFFSKGS